MTKYLFHAVGAAALAFSVMSCAAAAPAVAGESFSLTKITAATQADLAAAKADADAHGDVFASQCYAGVGAYVGAHGGGGITVPNVVGVASAFQVARDGVKIAESVQAGGAVPPELVQACGPLALDVQGDIGKAAGLTIFGLKLPF